MSGTWNWQYIRNWIDWGSSLGERILVDPRHALDYILTNVAIGRHMKRNYKDFFSYNNIQFTNWNTDHECLLNTSPLYTVLFCLLSLNLVLVVCYDILYNLKVFILELVINCEIGKLLKKKGLHKEIQLWFYWSCSSMVLKDATSQTPYCTRAKLVFFECKLHSSIPHYTLFHIQTFTVINILKDKICKCTDDGETPWRLHSLMFLRLFCIHCLLHIFFETT